MRAQITQAILAPALCMGLASTSLGVAAQGSAKPLPRDELQALAAAWSVLNDSLVYKADGKALIVGAIRGMLRSADPESGEYYTVEEFAEFKAGLDRSRVASGLEVRHLDGRYLLTPVDGGPASAAGVRFEDQLLAVDGVRVRGLTLNQVVRALSGSAGSRVALTVLRETDLKVHEITVERQAFRAPGPSVARAPGGWVVLRVSRFLDSTLQETVHALQRAWSEQPYRAVVLDLRGCPGGLLDTSIGVASIFLPGGEVVAHSHGAPAESNMTYRASRAFYLRRGGADPIEALDPAIRRLPLAVLVDGATASGAEIVAAALQEHRRAPVVGQRTFGRASIQTVTPLQLGGIKYTSAYWTSPGGRRLHGNGITPDTLLDNPWDDALVADALTRALR
ncbi:S41 family peptidase [Ramlibacter sp.]|uniref:S41 family peptidase n=1 Tax=Ramlibacter sp. TaxID=1917967 RepID=UPI0035B4C7BA